MRANPKALLVLAGFMMLAAPCVRADTDSAEKKKQSLIEARAAGAGAERLADLLDALLAEPGQPEAERALWQQERNRLRQRAARERAETLLDASETSSLSPETAAQMQAALAKLREAVRGDEDAARRHRELIRRLERVLQWHELKPLSSELDLIMEQVRNKPPAEAEGMYQRARSLQLEINRRFPGSEQAGEARLMRINADLQELWKSRWKQEVEARLVEAEAAMRAGETARGDAALRQAADLLRRGQAGSEGSGTAVEERGAFARRVQSIRALPAVLRLEALEREATVLLRAGSADEAAQRIEAARDALETAARAYPELTLEKNLRARLSYLSSRRERLGELQQAFKKLLAPIPGKKGVWMTRTEMPQELHELVAGLNPSRIVGPKLPVDSVNWQDASAVAERLGWIMGTTVRLPTQAEWRAALADGQEEAWLADGTESRQVRETGISTANSAGFHDLIGNVAEWLADEDQTRGLEALIAGGSVNDLRSGVEDRPFRAFDRNRRDRFVGYRLVLEASLQK